LSDKSLSSRLTALGLTITPAFNKGVLRSGAQWFTGRELEIGGVLVQLAWYGDFKQDVREEWRNEASTTLKGEDKKKLDAEIEAILAEERAAREAVFLEVQKEAEELWKNATDRGTHKYLEQKKLSNLHGTRIHVNESGHPVLLVPMRDEMGQLWNVQRIYEKKFDGTNSNKFMLKGGRKVGLFHTLGEIREASTVYICEGFSTGASVHEATGLAPTIICFDAGNLESVTGLLRAKYPGISFTFCADNDLWTRRPNGTPWNTGREKALLAASLVAGKVILPRFTSLQLEKRPTDFNDLHTLAGLKEVSEQITNPKHMVQEVVPLPKTGKGMRAKVSEKSVSDALLSYFDGRVIAFEQDLFIYKYGFWNLLNYSERNKIKVMIGRLAPDYGIRDIEGAFKYFVTHCPTPPPGVNLFQPAPDRANFADGTLHLIREKQRYRAEFRPHSKDDYLTSILPFDYIAPGAGGRNVEFDNMLQRVWQGDADIDGKIRLYKQVLGACICPQFPIIVMFVGKPGTGKSTLLKVMRRMVSPENCSSVDPADFHGFLMESMIGKLLNVNTDIDLSHPMQDAMVKKIIDRVPIQINRKHEKTVFAYLPAVHAFAANNLPKTLDGESRAYGRRMIIIRTDKFVPSAGHDQEFDQWVWEQGPEGIIAAAVEGLFDLLESAGHYHRPESSAQHVKKMQDRNDPVAMFLNDIELGHVVDGNTTLGLGENRRVVRASLWALFATWAKEEGLQSKNLGRNAFFESLHGKGYSISKIRGIWYVKGLGTEETQGSDF
jgi:phage/plasmid primase-like uncharacterized protein/energy-coupling factor transporter ATP-binding protein EcfA2